MKDSVGDRKAGLAAHLKRSVLTLALEPGADLDEAQLCEAFDVSRTPLREVFRELAGEGYLSLRLNRGARVSDLSHTTLRDFFLAAPMIYGAVMRLAALNATAQQIEALKLAQFDFRDALRAGSGAHRRTRPPADTGCRSDRGRRRTGLCLGRACGARSRIGLRTRTSTSSRTETFGTRAETWTAEAMSESPGARARHRRVCRL